MFLWFVQVDLVSLSTLGNRDTFTSRNLINTLLSQQMSRVPMTGVPSTPQFPPISATITSLLAPLSLASAQEPRGQHLERAPEQRAYHKVFVLEMEPMPVSASHTLFCIHCFLKNRTVRLFLARSRQALIHTYTFPQNQHFPIPTPTVDEEHRTPEVALNQNVVPSTFLQDNSPPSPKELGVVHSYLEESLEVEHTSRECLLGNQRLGQDSETSESRSSGSSVALCSQSESSETTWCLNLMD